MARVSYSFSVSLDGYFEAPDGSLDWGVVDEEWFSFMNGRQAEIGAYLYGRGLYENMAAYWPSPRATDPGNPPYVLEWARIWRAMSKVVFSNTLETVAWNSRLVRGEAADEVARLRALPGKDLSVGGADLAASLIRRDLIDLYELFVQPIVLGAGRPLFPRFEERLALRLIETRRFQSGVVQLRYERTR